MKYTVILVLLTGSFVLQSQCITAQKLEPTMTEAVLNVTVINEAGGGSIGDTIWFKGRGSGASYFGVSDDSGKFSVILPNDEVYDARYKDRNGNVQSAPIELVADQLILVNWELKYELPKTYTLDNVFFDTGKSTLRSKSFDELNELVDVLNYNNNMVIEISGHTDNVGDETGNQRLSESRAKAVRAYLLKNGIDPERVKAVGHGESQPIAPNSTEEGKQKNRRTEVRILSK
jgi:outer membrane protein OmpA-like peptidoglycan-associated protein